MSAASAACCRSRRRRPRFQPLYRGGLTGVGIRDSGIRVSRPGPPGPPSPPSPLSRGGGRGGADESGEGQALRRTSGLPLRGGFPVAFQRIPRSVRRREGGENTSGGAWLSPRPPICRCAAALRTDTYGMPDPVNRSGGGGRATDRGRAKPPQLPIAASRLLPDGSLPLSDCGEGERTGSGEGSAPLFHGSPFRARFPKMLPHVGRRQVGASLVGARQLLSRASARPLRGRSQRGSPAVGLRREPGG